MGARVQLGQNISFDWHATVHINAPPTEGAITVEPTSGRAVITSFRLSTSGWSRMKESCT